MRPVFKRLMVSGISLVFVAGAILAVFSIKPRSSSASSGAETYAAKIVDSAGNSYKSGKKTKTTPKTSAPVPGAKHALIVFTFDDGNESDYLLAYPILKKYGINGTSYINPYNADHNVAYKLSWNEIKKMYMSGWNIGDHTYTHINLNKATPDDINRSMEEDNKSFLRNGLPVPDVFAYPYGAFNSDNEKIIGQYRKQARLAFYRNDFVDFNTLNPCEVPCISADMKKSKLLKEHEKIVDLACNQGAVIVFRVHCMYKNTIGDTGKQPVETSSKLFAQLVNYCVKKGCEFTTMDGLKNLYDKSSGGNGSPKIANYAIETSWQESEDSADCYCYSKGNGLYKANLDGSKETKLQAGQYIKEAGCLNGWVYFTDTTGKLYRINENGGKAALVSSAAVSSVVTINGKLYCIQSGKICVLNAKGKLTPVIAIPKKILTEAKGLITDGNSLYLSVYYQQSLCDVYKYDTAVNKILLQFTKISDNPVLMENGYAIQLIGNVVYKQEAITGNKEELFKTSGLVMDMTRYKDWLVYITKSVDGESKKIEGHNLTTGKTFELETKCDYFIKTLSSGIITCDSEHNDTLYKVQIDGDEASIKDFQ